MIFTGVSAEPHTKWWTTLFQGEGVDWSQRLWKKRLLKTGENDFELTQICCFVFLPDVFVKNMFRNKIYSWLLLENIAF